MGTLTKKIHRHEALETISPPMTGPRTGPITVGTPMTLMTLPMRCGPAARARIDWPMGRIMPPPSPCATRNTISDGADQATPHNTDPAMKRVSEIIHIRLAPTRSTAQPVTGMTRAKASK